MNSKATFVFGQYYAAYFGPSGENVLHQHAAIQMVLSTDEKIVVLDASGTRHEGKSIFIRPLVLHSLHPARNLAVIYIEPHSRLGKELLDFVTPKEIIPLPEHIAEIFNNVGGELILDRLDEYAGTQSPDLDRRLSGALKLLSMHNAPLSIAEAARAVDVSSSTLRILAREQLGVPLSTWLIWRKLGRASKALSRGETISAAAQIGGFSDQAHFSRVMKRMFGITPSAAKESLNWQARCLAVKKQSDDLQRTSD